MQQPSVAGGPYYMQQQSTLSPGAHSHLVCGGCQTLLMYPQQQQQQHSAVSVRCSRCGYVTAAPSATAPVSDSAQVVCNGCRVLLSYPRSAQSVQCSLCHTVTQVPVYGHVSCGGCTIMLMFPLGAQSVKCSVCHYVTNVANCAPWATAAPGPGPSGSSSSAARPALQQPKPATQTVVVENPPTLDDHGNEVSNIAVGLRETQP